jgi:hypothetical protein
MYACSGATDYYLETGDLAYWKTLNRCRAALKWRILSWRVTLLRLKHGQ